MYIKFVRGKIKFRTKYYGITNQKSILKQIMEAMSNSNCPLS